MPTAPYAKALISQNGLTPVGGFLTPAAALDTMQLSGESISGWTQARWELFQYPEGWPTPASWSVDASGVIYSTSITPALITLPARSGVWGKWLGRLTVNNGVKNGVAGHVDMVDQMWGWEVLSPNLGLREIGAQEEAQASALRGWTVAEARSKRVLDGSDGLGRGYKALATADATVTTVQTYAMPDASAVVVEFYALAKKVATSTAAFFAYRHVFYRSGGGAPTAIGALEDLGSRPNGTAWTVDITPSSNNILARVTGQAATAIEWQTICKTLVITDTTA